MSQLPNIALIGKAGSGKDSVANHLIASRSYTRIAFADPVRDMALRINPVVEIAEEELWDVVYGENVHEKYFTPKDLSEIVSADGWETAKLNPEVRRFLQALGQSVREDDENFWLRLALQKIGVAAGWNLPVVVTDCRYRNEAESLRAAGFMLVRVSRPGAADLGVNAKHVSETELDGFVCDREIWNHGSLAQLSTWAEALVR